MGVQCLVGDVLQGRQTIGEVRLLEHRRSWSCPQIGLVRRSEVNNRLVGTLKYATALLDGATVERYFGYFRTLLAQMVADDHRAIDSLPLLSDGDRHRMLFEWNDTEVAYPDRRIHELFEEQVARTPYAIALTFEGEEISAATFTLRSTCCARNLCAPGACGLRTDRGYG